MEQGLIDEILEAFRNLRQRRPEAVSAALLGLAIERKVLTRKEAEALADRLTLADVEGISGSLTLRLDEQGRKAELTAIVQELRRVQRYAEGLLKRRP
jgi:hypothetical protein